MSELFSAWRGLGPSVWIFTRVGALVSALLIGIPTDVVPNPWFTRMTPVRLLDVVFLIATATLTGALLASYLTPGSRTVPKAVLGSGVLSVLAVGCPVCNKLVVALLGISGALSFFAPLQPILGLAAVALVAFALRARLNALAGACPSPALQTAPNVLSG